MAASCSSSVHGVLPIIPPQARNRTRLKSQTLSLTHSQFLSSSSTLSLRTPILLPRLQTRGLRQRNSHVLPVCAVQSNIFRVIQTVSKVARDGIEAGTNLVPVVVPRPIAKLSVTIAAGAVSLFVVKSFLSTVFFALGVMGFVYFVYIALNKDKGSKLDESPPAPKSTDEAIEEARKIMEKYK